MVSGDSIRFFAWLIRLSTALGCSILSSMFKAFMACLTTASWSDES